jgi:hypothetical protein
MAQYTAPIKPIPDSECDFKLWLVYADNDESREDYAYEWSIVWARSKVEAINLATSHPQSSYTMNTKAEEFAIYAGSLSFEHDRPCVLCFI